MNNYPNFRQLTGFPAQIVSSLVAYHEHIHPVSSWQALQIFTVDVTRHIQSNTKMAKNLRRAYHRIGLGIDVAIIESAEFPKPPDAPLKAAFQAEKTGAFIDEVLTKALDLDFRYKVHAMQNGQEGPSKRFRKDSVNLLKSIEYAFYVSREAAATLDEIQGPAPLDIPRVSSIRDILEANQPDLSRDLKEAIRTFSHAPMVSPTPARMPNLTSRRGIPKLLN